jgi:hypothetical protein
LKIEASPDGDAFSIAGSGDGSITITGANDVSLLAGVYHLLDQAGYRFLAPNLAHYEGSAEVAPKTPRLPKLDPPISRSAKLKFRKLYVEEGHSHTIENLRQIVEWMPKVGYNTLVVPTNYQGKGRVKWDNWREQLTPELQKRGITIEVGGHGYQNFINAEMPAPDGGALFEKHPDWFAADARGQRQKAPAWVFCTSNAAAVDTFINNFLAYIKDRPEIDIYDLWPPDGAKWCECAACKALGTPSDRQAILLKQVLVKVKPIRPDLRLEVIAYASYVDPPEHETIDPAVLIDFCPINQQFDAQISDPAAEKNNQYAQALAAWRRKFTGDISIYSYYRKYAWDSLPAVIPHYMQADLKWYAGAPVQGVSTYAEPGDWATYELNHYVLAALGWDPGADVDALVAKFCEARYGDEAPLAQRVMATLEKTTRVYGGLPHTSLKSADAIAAARDEVRERLGAVSAAQARAADKPVKLALRRLELMCGYLLRDLEIQHLRATGADKDQIRQQAAALSTWLASHADAGVFLTQRLKPDRPSARYGLSDRRRATAPAAE